MQFTVVWFVMSDADLYPVMVYVWRIYMYKKTCVYFYLSVTQSCSKERAETLDPYLF